MLIADFPKNQAGGLKRPVKSKNGSHLVTPHHTTHSRKHSVCMLYLQYICYAVLILLLYHNNKKTAILHIACNINAEDNS